MIHAALPPEVLFAALFVGAFTLALGVLEWFARALNRRRPARGGYVYPPAADVVRVDAPVVDLWATHGWEWEDDAA